MIPCKRAVADSAALLAALTVVIRAGFYPVSKTCAYYFCCIPTSEVTSICIQLQCKVHGWLHVITD